MGQPIEKNISTSYMERWNLTLRMQNRRFTRLTNAFSKKFENHRHMIAMTVVY
jgi:IS1 family transposase